MHLLQFGPYCDYDNIILYLINPLYTISSIVNFKF